VTLDQHTQFFHDIKSSHNIYYGVLLIRGEVCLNSSIFINKNQDENYFCPLPWSTSVNKTCMI